MRPHGLRCEFATVCNTLCKPSPTMPATPLMSVLTPLRFLAMVSTASAPKLTPSCLPDRPRPVRVLRLPAFSMIAALTESSSFRTSSPTERAHTTGSAVDAYSLWSLSQAERILWFSKYRSRA